MTAPTDIQTPFAPLPVRARGTLEIFDTAFKLFRRYAGVLLAWSALSGLINLIPIVGSLVYIFTMPLLYGAVSCVVAGAVRGQNVGFKQIWGFTKPRYGALLGVLILAGILLSVVMFALMFGISLIVILLASAAANFGVVATIIAWIIGTLGGLIGGSFLLAVVMGWFNLAPVIACLEDANRGSGALSRAWSLLSGNWRKASGVATILALAGTAAMLIVATFVGFFFLGGWDKLVGANAADSFLSGLAFSGVFTLFFVVWTPLQAVVGAVFYLDLRTRKEALDLEWTNYAAKPEALVEQVPMAPQFSPAPGLFPPGGPSYAPGLPLPAQPDMTLQAPPMFNAQTSVITPSQFPAQAQPDSALPIPFAEQPNVAFAPAPVAVADVPAPSDSFAAQVEAAPAEMSVAQTPAVEAQVPTLPVQFPPAPQPPATPVQPPLAAPISATSSFAPPPRFRRAKSDDDDNPSSFGGGA